MFMWQTLRAADGRVETVDGWATLAEVVWEMACSSWEEPGNHWLSYVVDDAAGLVAATALFGPGGELLVTLADGRRFTFPVPEFYRADEPEPVGQRWRCRAARARALAAILSIPAGGFARLRLLRRLSGRLRCRPAGRSARKMALQFLEQFAAYMQGRS